MVEGSKITPYEPIAGFREYILKNSDLRNLNILTYISKGQDNQS